ncbi:MAG: hypothetical protein HAW59_02730, partial [Betaproteobacteria bacterium]|nr:hypothetical protein [Betaproteobacteria bacterium]
MSEIRDDRKYTQTHEWVLDNGDNTYTMGISDHAQALLGDMVYVELPSVGDEVNAEDEFCVVESVKAASGIFAPADLEIVADGSRREYPYAGPVELRFGSRVGYT